MQAQSAYHICNLPRELLDTLTLRTLFSDSPSPSKPVLPLAVDDGKQVQDASGTNIGSRACNICLGVTFSDVDEQRTHFRSDWHRYNVKTRLNGGQSVSEEAFSQLVEGSFAHLVGCISPDFLRGLFRLGGFLVRFSVFVIRG